MNSDLLITKYRDAKSVTRKEIMELGYTKYQIDKLRFEGILARQKRGVYKVVENRNYNDLMNEAQNLRIKKNYEEALLYTKEALKLKDTPYGRISALADLLILEKYEEAFQVVNKFLKTYDKTNLTRYEIESFNILANILNYFYPLDSSILKMIPPKEPITSEVTSISTLYYQAAIEHLESASFKVALKYIKSAVAQASYAQKNFDFMYNSLIILIERIKKEQAYKEGYTSAGIANIEKVSHTTVQKMLYLIQNNQINEARALLDKKINVDNRTAHTNKLYNNLISILFTEIENLIMQGKSSYQESDMPIPNINDYNFLIERYIISHDFKKADIIAWKHEGNEIIKILLQKIFKYTKAIQLIAAKDEVLDEKIQNLIYQSPEDEVSNFKIKTLIFNYLKEQKLSSYHANLIKLNIAKRFYMEGNFEMGDTFYYDVIPNFIKNINYYINTKQLKEQVASVREYMLEKKHFQ